MEEQNNKPRGLDQYRAIGFAVTVASYFIIKYGIAASMFNIQDTSNILYSLGLILGCMLIGRSAERWLRSRAEK